MTQYRALRVEQTESGFQQILSERSLDELPDHPLLMEVHYSSLNYKDALSAFGKPGVTKDYPHTPGIDAAGVVVEDRSGTFQAGDQVIVCGYDFGMNTPGGLSEMIRVPSEWAVPLPEKLSLRESMIAGTAGFTAALCVQKILHQGARPADGPVLVTGATGGVGSFSVALLAHLGFEVIAVTGKAEQADFLRSLGANSILDRSQLSEPNKRPLGKTEWAHAIDCVGGVVLSNVLKGLNYGGSVAICGLAASPVFEATVLPFILRNINLLGVDCVELPLAEKAANWQRLASDLKLPQLNQLAEEITLAETPEYLQRFLNGATVGRYLVKIR